MALTVTVILFPLTTSHDCWPSESFYEVTVEVLVKLSTFLATVLWEFLYVSDESSLYMLLMLQAVHPAECWRQQVRWISEHLHIHTELSCRQDPIPNLKFICFTYILCI